MLKRTLLLLTVVASLIGLTACGTPLTVPPASGGISKPAKAAPALDKLPLYFVANRGQTDSHVSFYVPGQDNTIFFAPDGLTFAFTSAPTPTRLPALGARDTALLSRGALDSVPQAAQRWAVKLDYVGANSNVQPLGESKADAVFSYFQGQESQWKGGVPSFAQLRYHDLWPGIDLVYSGQANQLKYQFEVQPGADPAEIQLAYRGASAVRLTADGQLEVTTPRNSFRDAAPVAYQVKNGQRVPVEMRYALGPAASAGEAARYEYGFHLGAYDASLPLVLDPAVLVYAGYIGGAGIDEGNGIAVDSAGNAYVTGNTLSAQATFPAKVGPDLTYNGGFDAFVAKVNAAGTALIYAGYIGGSGDDYGSGIAVDKDGNAYVAGVTTSNQTADAFPVAGGPDLTYNGGTDAFVAKVNAAGTALVYSGYVGGSGIDQAKGIAVDGAGNAYVTGYTASSQATFPVTGGPDLTYNGATDAFVAKVNAAGTALVYAGYIGGSGADGGYGIAVDSSGHAYVTGNTASTQTTFPVMVGPDLTGNGGTEDAFVAKVNIAGTALVYAGYIGGSGDDAGFGIAVDTTGNAYVTGATSSDQNTFPVLVGPHLIYHGNYDAFVAKVDPAGTALVYAGYIGGANDDEGHAIAVDGAGNAYVAGMTLSNQTADAFPVTSGPDLTYNGNGDAFVAKVNASATTLDYAGYIGGAFGEFGTGIAVDNAGNAYITGNTGSNETADAFPVTVGPDLTYNGGNSEAFVAKVAPSVPFVPTAFLRLPLVQQ